MSQTEPTRAGAADEQRLLAAASLFRHDAERILGVASRLRGARCIVESKVHGECMGSAVPAGSLIRIDLVCGQEYRVGQVIAFILETTVVVHRVVRGVGLGRAKSYLITRSDMALLPDPPVRVKRVLGPVVGCQMEGRWAPPGPPPLQPPLRRFLSLVLLTLVHWSLRVDVRLARWLTIRLRASTRSFANLRAARRRSRRRNQPAG